MKKILIPSLLTISLTPIISTTNCSRSKQTDIVLNVPLKILIYGDFYLHGLRTNEPYSIEKNTEYDFTIDMKKWQGPKENVDHFTIILNKLDAGLLGIVAFIEESLEFETDDGTKLSPSLDPDGTNIDFNGTDNVAAILNSQHIYCHIKTNNQEIIDEPLYFLFYNGE